MSYAVHHLAVVVHEEALQNAYYHQGDGVQITVPHEFVLIAYERYDYSRRDTTEPNEY